MHFGSVLARWVYTFLTTCLFHLFVRWFFFFSSSPPHSGLASQRWRSFFLWCIPCFRGLEVLHRVFSLFFFFFFFFFLRHFVHPSPLVLGWVVFPSFLSASSLESLSFSFLFLILRFSFLSGSFILAWQTRV